MPLSPLDAVLKFVAARQDKRIFGPDHFGRNTGSICVGQCFLTFSRSSGPYSEVEFDTAWQRWHAFSTASLPSHRPVRQKCCEANQTEPTQSFTARGAKVLVFRHEILKCNLKVGTPPDSDSFYKMSSDCAAGITKQLATINLKSTVDMASVMQVVVQGPMLEMHQKQVSVLLKKAFLVT